MSKFMYFVAFSENFQKKKQNKSKKNLIWIVKLKKIKFDIKRDFLKKVIFVQFQQKINSPLHILHKNPVVLSRFYYLLYFMHF